MNFFNGQVFVEDLWGNNKHIFKSVALGRLLFLCENIAKALTHKISWKVDFGTQDTNLQTSRFVEAVLFNVFLPNMINFLQMNEIKSDMSCVFIKFSSYTLKIFTIFIGPYVKMKLSLSRKEKL